ncbi:MAG: sterol desaturase family protein [Hyphomonas sp.]|uniref:sterol desaturase family protein n=1 Tax=Hyphomonas sp. TaxID=87 RepID=UPI003003665B
MADVSYVILATVIILVIEALSGSLKGARIRDFGVTAICFLSNSAVTRPIAGLLIGGVVATLLPAHAGAWSDMPLWQSFLLGFFLMEFGFYWMHRWAHEGQRQGSRLSWLWKIHRTHHSADHLNVSVTMRQNIFWAFVVPNSWIVGLAVYIGIGEGAALALIVIYAWNLLTHTHYRWDDPLLALPVFRGLQHVIVTPSMHHSHHGFGKDGKMYRNYAVMFSAYDWLFGTLHLPLGRPSRYGVPGETPAWTEEAFFPLTLVSDTIIRKGSRHRRERQQ